LNLTPSQKGSFLAGVGLWVLIWASVWKADDIGEAMRIQRWFKSSYSKDLRIETRGGQTSVMLYFVLSQPKVGRFLAACRAGLVNPVMHRRKELSQVPFASIRPAFVRFVLCTFKWTFFADLTTN
jgi:hypothetical protein